MTYLLTAYIIILLTVFSYIFRINIKLTKGLKKIYAEDIKQEQSSHIDHSNKRLLIICLVSLILFLITYMALIWAPAAKGEPPTYRIIYFHVSVAIMAYIGFFTNFIGSIFFLWKKNMGYDRWAKVGSDLGVHFSILMVISGMIWGKQRWGAWWVWEPRLTTALILLLTYVGYSILRHIMDNNITRAKYASVYGIIAFINVPAVHYAIKMWGSIMHPVIEKTESSSGLSSKMTLTLTVCQAVFLIIFIVMYLFRLRLDQVETDIYNHLLRKKD